MVRKENLSLQCNTAYCNYTETGTRYDGYSVLPVDYVWISNSVDTQLPLIFTRNIVPRLEIGLLTGKILTVYIILFI